MLIRRLLERPVTWLLVLTLHLIGDIQTPFRHRPIGAVQSPIYWYCADTCLLVLSRQLLLVLPFRQLLNAYPAVQTLFYRCSPDTFTGIGPFRQMLNGPVQLSAYQRCLETCSLVLFGYPYWCHLEICLLEPDTCLLVVSRHLSTGGQKPIK